ncbi:sensor histidine kinase [Fibrobacter sp.]|uniref:sensor histidine kinase n=1 Tax=Fibrobacter sp. TaxID=35828 RepID=UPI00388F049E
MVRVSRNNLLFFALFAGGIVLPTAILSLLSFRNIQNEIFLAQKNFDESKAAFQKEIEETLSKEQERIYQETKAASLFLYELPKSLLEFGNAATFKDVKGIEAIFLYNDGQLVYPDISSRHFNKTTDFSNTVPSPSERQLFWQENNPDNQQNTLLSRSFKMLQAPFETKNEQVQNMLGLIRISYKQKDYDEALRLLSILETHPHLQGYLHADITRAANLLHFEILVKQKKHQEAEDYCLSVLSQFLQSPNIENIPSAKFFFEEAFTQILSFEKLTQEKREAFWNLRANFNRQLGYMDILAKHRELFNELLDNEYTSKDGILFRNDDDITLFKMTYPLLSGNQIVIAKLDNEAFRERILDKLKATALSWKNIPYSVTNEKDSLLLGSIPDSAKVLTQISITDAYDWEFALYEKDVKEIRKESRQRMFLMYGLLSFSLITVILGSFFMLRFITQERKLLAMKANFLSSVSHELKTPLTSIKMFAEMMARGRVQKTEKVQEYSALIGKESTRLENLIGAILNYTRMEHGKGAFKWERLDFSACVQKVYDAVEDIGIEKGLEFHTHFEPNTFVMGDHTALYSLAQNLIENAIKYTNAPGDITINVYNEDEHVVFSVSDTGVGIPASEQKNIFNDFYRVGDEMTRSTKGSGLGLAIVKRVAETHKATISLSSKPGKGSTFTIRFKKVE